MSKAKITTESLICTACGSEAGRRFARFCRVCGKLLREDYEPLDTLRASYRMQGKTFRFEAKAVEKPLPPAATAAAANLFEENKNSASSTAWAFVVYSLVPYLGILFCPGAILLGTVGIYVSYRQPQLGGGRTSAYSIALGFVIFCIQVLLWWLLYLIPDLGRGG